MTEFTGAFVHSSKAKREAVSHTKGVRDYYEECTDLYSRVMYVE